MTSVFCVRFFADLLIQAVFEAGKELDKIVWFGTLFLVPSTKLSEGQLNYAVG